MSVASGSGSTGEGRNLDSEAALAEIARLAPWHFNVEITPTLRTSAFREARLAPEQTKWQIPLLDHQERWKEQIRSIYPDGVAGRTTLDCGCNCGAYSFWTRELGSAGGLGLDVRKQWIDQARFLQTQRQAPSGGLRFEVRDLYELPAIAEAQYDITIFKGLFHHLPDPIHGLKLAAERTRELLIINTLARTDLADGMLVSEQEGTDHPLSGVYGFRWLPTGPNVLVEILKSIGFTATRRSAWNPEGGSQANQARLEILAAREETTFEHLDNLRRERGPQRGAQQRPRQQQRPGPGAARAPRPARTPEVTAAQQARKQASMAERAARRGAAAAERAVQESAGPPQRGPRPAGAGKRGAGRGGAGQRPGGPGAAQQRPAQGPRPERRAGPKRGPGAPPAGGPDRPRREG